MGNKFERRAGRSVVKAQDDFFRWFIEAGTGRQLLRRLTFDFEHRRSFSHKSDDGARMFM